MTNPIVVTGYALTIPPKDRTTIRLAEQIQRAIDEAFKGEHK